MKALISPSGSSCVLEDAGRIAYLNLSDGSEIPAAVFHALFHGDGEWVPLQAKDQADLLAHAQKMHAALRAISNIETCLFNISNALRLRLLKEVEYLSKVQAISREVVARLLCAPLRDPSTIQSLIKLSLSSGYGATADMLEQIYQQQAHLKRLTSIWLKIPDNEFKAFVGGRKELWNRAIGSHVVLDTLHSVKPPQVKSAWGRLAFEVQTPLERAAVASVAQFLATALFEGYSAAENQEVEDDEPAYARRSYVAPGRSPLLKQRALKQIDAIVDAVSRGDDEAAYKYLTELVDAQTKYEDGEKHAVKSLCNIAKSCADMFRTDFEHECLQRARELLPTDAWTLVQLADHYKRVAKFDEAIETAQLACSYTTDIVARSTLADIYVQLRDYDRATSEYRAIPAWESEESIRTALAGILRKQQRLDEARDAYEKMLAEGFNDHRVFSGLAEVLKLQGQFEHAGELYRRILEEPELLEPATVHIYMLGYANVLVRQGEFRRAYNLLDNAVEKRPFDVRARTFKAAIAGIVGNAKDALNGLPFMGQTKAFGEWVLGYVRGLTLMMLRRYDEAHDELFKKIDRNLFDADADSLRRLAAVVYFLKSRAGVSDAADLLAKVPPVQDAFVNALRNALSLHIAVSMSNNREIARLDDLLSNDPDRDLRELRSAIRSRDWPSVKRLEIKVLLRLAS